MGTKPTIITTHDYVTVNFGNGRRLTGSYGGEKATGAIPKHVWQAWLALLDNPADTRTLGERIQKFVDDINSLWPEWNVPPKTFNVGDTVKMDFGKRGGMDTGTIIKKAHTNYTIRFEKHGLVGINGDLLSRYN